MNIDIKTIQVKPQNPAEFVAFLENYGFDWKCDKEQISPNDYPWIILYLDSKDIGGNEEIRELLTMPENVCKLFVENNFEKKQLIVKVGDIVAKGNEEYIVALVASDSVKLISLYNGNRYDDFNYSTERMFSEIPLKGLVKHGYSEFRIVKKGKGWD